MKNQDEQLEEEMQCNTGTRMLDSIYHMTLKLFLKYFCAKNRRILPYA